GRAHARFLVNGIRHISNEPRTVAGHVWHVTSDQQEAALRSLTDGATVAIQSEDDNPRDSAAALVTVEGFPVGWVPRVLSIGVRQLLAAGPLHATVHRIAKPGTTPHVRLVLDVDAPTPSGFAFDPRRQWEPLVGR